MKEDIETIRQSILASRFRLWHDLLRDLERTAEPGHTVVRFPNSSTYIFSTGTPDRATLLIPMSEFDGLQNFLFGEIIAVRPQAEIFTANINRVRSIMQRHQQALSVSRRGQQFRFINHNSVWRQRPQTPHSW